MKMIDMDKLTIEQLKNYLGTGLRIGHPWGSDKTWELHYDTDLDIDNRCSIKYVLVAEAKPIMYRLSDLDKFIPELGFVPIEHIPYGNKLVIYKPINHGYDIEINIQTEDYSQEIDLYDGFKIMSLLFQWHFWPFDQSYFEKGLIIDKLTYK